MAVLLDQAKNSLNSITLWTSSSYKVGHFTILEPWATTSPHKYEINLAALRDIAASNGSGVIRRAPCDLCGTAHKSH